MNDVLPRPGATLMALQMRDFSGEMLTPFVKDEHDDFWSVVADIGGTSCPVQKHTTDGWVAAVFYREFGRLMVVAPLDEFTTKDGRHLVAIACCKHHRGIRWLNRVPPSSR